MRALFGWGPSSSPTSTKGDEAKAGELLERAQSSLNSLRLQTHPEQSFVLLNAAQSEREAPELRQMHASHSRLSSKPPPSPPSPLTRPLT